MATDINNWLALSNTHYYLREEYYGTALKNCEVRVKQSDDPELSVLRGVALILLGKPAEAIRILENQRKGTCSLGALHALRWAHSLAANPDKQSLSEIDADMTKASKDSSVVDNICSAASVLYYSEQYSKAKTLLERMASQEDADAKILSLLGWVEIALGRDQKSTSGLFEAAIGKGYPDAHVGKARLLERRHASAEMKLATKDLTQNVSSFLPGHIEYCKAALVGKEWDNAFQGLQTASAASVEQDSPVIQLLLTIHAICSSGMRIDSELHELQQTLEAAEKDNHVLHYRLGQLFVRLAAKNRSILQFAKSLIQRAIQMNKKPDYLVEAMRIAISLDDVKEVTDLSRQLVQLDVDNAYAALAMTLSFLMQGRVPDALQQYQFSQEAHGYIKNTALFYYVGAVINRHQGKDFEESRKMVETAADMHLAALQGIPFGIEYLRALDADFLMSLVYLLLEFAPPMPVKAADASLKCCERILTLIVENCPGQSLCTFLLARVRYLHSDYEGADQMIDVCLKKNEASAEAYLLRAQIRLEKGQVEDADKCLNTGLNFNFAVRESSIFHLIKARVHIEKHELDRAADLLKTGLKAPKREKSVNLLGRREGTDSHRISLQLQLIHCLQLMKRTGEADATMNEALAQWKGLPEEEQLMLMNAQLLVAKGDPDSALAILAKVKPDQPNYQSARMKMAEIYLEEKKDKRMFTVCYRELVKTAPTPNMYILLGDAYMSVQEPEKAIEVYEQALKLSSKNLALAEKIGEAYVMCHLYTKAVNFYESAMNSTKDKKMRLNLANLLFKLKNYEKCEKVLKHPLDEESNTTDIETLLWHVQFMKLLSKLQLEKERGDWHQSVAILEKAKTLQAELVRRSDMPGVKKSQLNTDIAETCCELADLYSMRSAEMTKAVEAYKDAIVYKPNDAKIQLALAQLYYNTGKLHPCNNLLSELIKDKTNPNYDAILLLGDVHYKKSEGGLAIVQYGQIIEERPNNYHALARCIELAMRSGDLQMSERALKKALDHNPRASIDAGYNYCKGLHEWYTGEPNAALQAFNRARKDPEWGEKAIYNLIEICVNPENEVVEGDMDSESRRENAEERAMASTTAKNFLQELHYKHSHEWQYQLMHNFILIATNDRDNIISAQNWLLNEMEMDDGKTLRYGAVLGVARAFILQKQIPKAKAILKKTIGATFNFDEADHLEKCWLLLADIYLGQNKSEPAKNLLREVLKYKASSVKAHELLGYLQEKSQNFIDASNHYMDAWKHSRQKNPVIGYKLAYNLLKCKAYFECMDICRKVLQQYPTFPKIRKEILDKARSSIRT